MNKEYMKLQSCYESFTKKIDFRPEIALILGSGLGDLADEIQIEATLDYTEIKDFPVSTVSGHKGRFVFGYMKEVPVVIMQGRVHYYEGYEMSDVVLPTRLMKMMGAKILFLTNASGGINTSYKVGDFMLLTGHISSFVPTPLIGENVEAWGVRFPDMSDVYDKKLQNTIRETAKNVGIPIQEGVYLQTTGPQYESPEEIKMYRILGADAVGMSTACEAIAANHMGMQICGISCITNMACGILDQPLSHAEVKETADKVAPLFKTLVMETVANFGKLI